ncbi:hypothetical protein MMON_51090 [Mycolicibacterium monacense]|uniref:Uncharacterized protein n=1 Tax=Mycolicibacterium monacense TaxID=85693 RepID=A0AAD1J106_MYCMB|nr:hypothetical protein MMON_51090 [Mycolicibacterium monacense]
MGDEVVEAVVSVDGVVCVGVLVSVDLVGGVVRSGIELPDCPVPGVPDCSSSGFDWLAAGFVRSGSSGSRSTSPGESAAVPAPTGAAPPSSGSASAIAPPTPARDMPAATTAADAATRTRDPTWSPPLKPVSPEFSNRCDDSRTIVAAHLLVS